MSDTDKYDDVVKQVTAVVRAADRAFESSGGSSRHWVREQFLPRLEDAGLVIMQRADLDNAKRAEAAAEQRYNDLVCRIPPDPELDPAICICQRQIALTAANARADEAEAERRALAEQVLVLATTDLAAPADVEQVAQYVTKHKSGNVVYVNAAKVAADAAAREVAE